MSKMKMEIRSLPISMSPTDSSEGLSVKGLVNGAGSVSELLTNPSNGRKFKETISPGVFGKAISDASRIDFLSQHDKSMILSTTDNDSLELRETDNGLEMSASISSTSWGRDTFQLIKDGIIKGMSFGMRVANDTWSVDSDGIPMRTINGIDLFEVSAVRNPAYRSSDIEARDIDIINDVTIPEDIEERSKKMAEEKTTTTTTTVKPEEDSKTTTTTTTSKPAETTTTTTKKPDDKATDKRDDDDYVDESRSLARFNDLNSKLDVAQSSITDLTAQLKELRELVENKSETENRDDNENSDDASEEERSLTNSNKQEEELRSFFDKLY